MTKTNLEKINLKAIRFSLFLKVLICGWSLYIAISSKELSIGLIYLALAIIFAGLFIFQLKYYQKKKDEMQSPEL